MNTAEMKAQLAAIKAKQSAPAKRGVRVIAESDSSLLEGTAHVLGAVPSHVISAAVVVGRGTGTFFDAMVTGFKHAEAKRTGKL